MNIDRTVRAAINCKLNDNSFNFDEKNYNHILSKLFGRSDP